MKLLIITQKVDLNDSNLGFFHRWLEKFSEKLEKVYVVGLSVGEYNLSSNVEIFSLGKEKGYSKIRQLIRLKIFLLKNLKEIDGIFIHMCPIYAVIAYPLARIFRKKIILWYVHKSVNWKLKLAQKLVDKILTASEESCRLKSRKKVRIIGHGVDTDLFSPGQRKKEEVFKIVSAGRISPVKDQKTLIEAIDILVNQRNFKDIEVKIIGSPIEVYEKKYFEKLKNLVQEKKLGIYIEFIGGVSYNLMSAYYQNADLCINLSHTGSIDKVVLEAMACGCLVLTCNEAFSGILEQNHFFEKKNPENLAEKIIYFKNAVSYLGENIREFSRKSVVKSYSLDNLINEIILIFKDR